MKSKNLKVFMVDDEPDIINVIKGILKQAGHKDIQIASNGKKALTKLNTFKPDLIFS